MQLFEQIMASQPDPDLLSIESSQLTSPDRRNIKTADVDVTSPSDSVTGMASMVTFTSLSTCEMVASTGSAIPLYEEVVSVPNAATIPLPIIVNVTPLITDPKCVKCGKFFKSKTGLLNH